MNNKDLIDNAKVNRFIDFDEFVAKNKSIILLNTSQKLCSVTTVDLTKIDPVLADGLVMWLLNVNRRRIEKNQPIIITYNIIKACPLWKVIIMPMRTRRKK